MTPEASSARIIGALREVHEDLIDRFRQDEVDIHPAQHRCLQRVQQRLVGNEIGCRDHDAASGAVDQGLDQPLHASPGMVGAGGQHLGHRRARVDRLGADRRIVQNLLGLQKPVGDEHPLELQARRDRSCARPVPD